MAKGHPFNARWMDGFQRIVLVQERNKSISCRSLWFGMKRNLFFSVIIVTWRVYRAQVRGTVSHMCSTVYAATELQNPS
uniref:Uncharacterized protein n=1 Tax=Utricularia reniformis TaxID=192314 RepID=A0A1Y0B351_9LAMI|nr:hypothetical protein AEK19_MT1683 [Utricularia reniformis]ART31865.1 hypothetical protein AEK19_MT1683 [Utricularia reniformis]